MTKFEITAKYKPFRKRCLGSWSGQSERLMTEKALWNSTEQIMAKGRGSFLVKIITQDVNPLKTEQVYTCDRVSFDVGHFWKVPCSCKALCTLKAALRLRVRCFKRLSSRPTHQPEHLPNNVSYIALFTHICCAQVMERNGCNRKTMPLAKPG